MVCGAVDNSNKIKYNTFGNNNEIYCVNQASNIIVPNNIKIINCIYCNKIFNDRSNKSKHEKICKNKPNIIEENKKLKKELESIKNNNQITPQNTINNSNNYTHKFYKHNTIINKVSCSYCNETLSYYDSLKRHHHECNVKQENDKLNEIKLKKLDIQKIKDKNKNFELQIKLKNNNEINQTNNNGLVNNQWSRIKFILVHFNNAKIFIDLIKAIKINKNLN